MSEFFNVNTSGNTYRLDPKSKIILTLVIVITISFCIEPFQVFAFALLSIPIYILYRPKKSFILKVLSSTPLMIIICTIFIISIHEDVTIHIFWFKRTYPPANFVFLIGFRFITEVLHWSILLESEENYQQLIEAIASFKINKNLVTILLMISSIIKRLQNDYQKMVMAAKSRGALSKSGLSSLYLKLRIFSNILVRGSRYAYTIGDTLTARGFVGKFTSKTRNWNSEGLTVLTIGLAFTIIIIISPLLRPH